MYILWSVSSYNGRNTDGVQINHFVPLVEINYDVDDYVIYDCDSNVPTQNSTANTTHQPASQQLTDDDTDNDNCVDNSSQLRAGRICDQGSHT